MTTVEKLFVQVFERKKRIIEQVKQQAELYNQHLASKCIIDGITPPSWLWNPNYNSQSSDPKELNKEELISELLLPHPRPAVPYGGQRTGFNKPVVTRDNGELSNGLFINYNYSNDVGAGNQPTTKLEFNDNDVERALNCVPEQDISVTSPENKTDIGISNIYNAPEQSLARIHRSKSRQKALESRNSAKLAGRSRFSHDKDNDISSSGNVSSGKASEQANHSSESLALSNVCGINEHCLGGEVKEGNFQEKERSKDIYSGRITRSRSSCKQIIGASPSLKLNSNSDVDKQDSSTSVVLSDNSLQHPENVNELFEAVNHSQFTAGSCGVRGATIDNSQEKEKTSNAYSGRITRSRFSSQQPATVIESSKIDVPIFTAKASNDALSQPITKSIQHVDDPNGLVELVKSSRKLVDRKTRLQINCDSEGRSKPKNPSSPAGYRVTQSLSGGRNNSLLLTSSNRVEGCALQNMLAGQVILPSSYVHEGAYGEGNAETVVGNELLPIGQIDPMSAYSRPSDCCMFLKPMQLDFDYVEESSLSGASVLKNTCEGKPSEAIQCNSPDEVNIDGINEKPVEILVEVEVDLLRKPEKTWLDSSEVNVDDCEEGGMKRSGSNYSDNLILKNVGDSSKSILHIGNSSDCCECNGLPSVSGKSPVAVIPQVNCHLTGGIKSLSKQQFEEGEIGFEDRDRSSAISLAGQEPGDTLDCLVDEGGLKEPASIFLHQSNHVQTDQNLLLPEDKFDCINAGELASDEKSLQETGSHLDDYGTIEYNLIRSPHVKNENVSCLKLKEIPLKSKSVPEQRLVSVTGDSWPQLKRRKIKHQPTCCFSASSSFRLEKFPNFQRDTINVNLRNAEDDPNSFPKFYPVSVSGAVVDKIPDGEMCQKMNWHLAEGSKSSPHMQIEEGGLCLKEGSKSPILKTEQRRPSPISSLTKQAAATSQRSLIEDVPAEDPTSIDLDVRQQFNDEDYEKLLHIVNNINLVNKNDSTQVESNLQENRSHTGKDSQLSNMSVGSPRKSDHNLTDADQYKPLFEGFIIDTQIENTELDIAKGGTNFVKLDLPSSTIERAGVLEQICKSASICTPLPHCSSTFKFDRPNNIFRSAPNGFLEHMNLKGSLPSVDDIDKQFSATYSCIDEANCSFQSVPYPDCVTFSGAKFSWNSKNPYLSPLGKLWDKLSLNSSSSEKKLSSNLELTCFPIEEDPNTSEENENYDEVVSKISAETDSIAVTSCSNRELLADITAACTNPPVPFSAAVTCPDRSSLASVDTDVSFTGTCKTDKEKLAGQCSNKRKGGLEVYDYPTVLNPTMVSNTNGGVKMSKESHHNRSSKPKLSGKSSLRKVQRLSVKENKRNNIVSNISSFVPLVQQKQTVAVPTGKRDVKVKALEAAEAAKRLEEKRENERKMKKEALKLERQRLEQENLRQMEFNKKKKEQEQKKKEADFAARKRRREEEERKERERKKKRIQETGRQQKDQGEKLHAVEVEKGKKCGTVDVKLNSLKGSNEESENYQRMGNKRGEGGKLKNPETRGGCLASDAREASNVLEAYGDNGKAMSMLDKPNENDVSATMITQQSYEISPYRCSDDEDEEEDELPNKKAVPSWASKICVAVELLSQQNLDPDVIFPRDSFCSVGQVLLPRKSQQSK